MSKRKLEILNQRPLRNMSSEEVETLKSMMRSGKLTEALNYCDEILQSNPNDSLALAYRGRIYHRKKRPVDALHDVNRAIHINPANDHAFTTRGRIYTWQKKYNMALKDLSKAITLNPNNEYALEQRGMIYCVQGKEPLAFPDFNQVLLLNPTNENALIFRGEIYRRQNKLEEAIADLNKSIELKPHGRAYGNLAYIYHKQGKYKEALDACALANALMKSSKMLELQATIYQSMGLEDLVLLFKYKAHLQRLEEGVVSSLTDLTRWNLFKNELEILSKNCIFSVDSDKTRAVLLAEKINPQTITVTREFIYPTSSPRHTPSFFTQLDLVDQARLIALDNQYNRLPASSTLFNHLITLFSQLTPIGQERLIALDNEYNTLPASPTLFNYLCTFFKQLNPDDQARFIASLPKLGNELSSSQTIGNG